MAVVVRKLAAKIGERPDGDRAMYGKGPLLLGRTVPLYGAITMLPLCL
jgi:hypothetical protein